MPGTHSYRFWDIWVRIGVPGSGYTALIRRPNAAHGMWEIETFAGDTPEEAAGKAEAFIDQKID